MNPLTWQNPEQLFVAQDIIKVKIYSVAELRVMKKYIPNPVDTKSVDLPKGLEPLVEEMSKNVHEVWAATRISQGWTYGKERNDAEKKHPCLVPYEELSEEEKEYDRNTSIETIKLILKLGFTITKG